MTRYRLTYFDFDGGRAEPLRIALHAAGIEFEDNRLSFAEFGALRADMRFNSIPVLEIDGTAVTQSNALNRYVGKLGGLYPQDDLQALYCDEVMGAVEDATHYLMRTIGLQGDALQAAREQFADGWLSVFLRGLDELLERGGDYFADGRLTVADLKVFVLTRGIRAGQLEHIPTDLVDRVAPGLAAHCERIAAEPVVTAYYDSRA